jgi:hypothetical protein
MPDMPGRLRSLALALVASTAMIVEPALASPPLPSSAESSEPPVEGPAPPPSEPSVEPPPPSIEPPPPSIEPPPPSIEPGFGEDDGIEFATPQGEPIPDPGPSPHEREIGKAPDSGAGFLAGGLWLVPVAGYSTVLLLVNNQATQYTPRTTASGIITAGVGIGAIGVTMIAMGAVRQVRLKRWATRHRVVALPQGSGLMTSGSLALVFGAVFLASGLTTGDIPSAAIGGVVLASAPIQIGVSIPLIARYRRTGGWKRTRFTLTPGGFAMQF